MKKLKSIKQIPQYAGLCILVILMSCSGKKNSNTEKEVIDTDKVEAESGGEWISLFDGKTLDVWKRYNAD